MTNLQTLIFIKHKGKILLGLKQRGIGRAKWNGFGGKLNDYETPEECVVREVYEECNLQLKISDVKCMGFMEYGSEEKTDRKVILFVCDQFEGVPKDSDEMKHIRWFDEKELPMDEMLEDCNFWMWMILKGYKFTGKIVRNDRGIINIQFQMIE